jgi:seryl-tRNA synthetase
MLDPALLRGQLAVVAERLATRGFDLDTNALEALEAERKAAQIETQELQNQRNVRSKAIGIAKGRGEDASELFDEVAAIGDHLKANEQRLADVQRRLADILLGVPNLPD